MTDRKLKVAYSMALATALVAGSPGSSFPTQWWPAAPQSALAQVAPTESVPVLPAEPPKLRDEINVPPGSPAPSSPSTPASVAAPAATTSTSGFGLRPLPPLPFQNPPNHFRSIRNQSPDLAREKKLLDQYRAAKKQHGPNSSAAFSNLLSLITYYLQSQQMKSVVEMGSEVDSTFGKLPSADQQEFATILLASSVELARMQSFEACKALYQPVLKAAPKADWKNAQALAQQMSILADQLIYRHADSVEPIYECAELLLERPPVSGQPSMDREARVTLKMKLIAVHARNGKQEKVTQEAEELLSKHSELTAKQKLILYEQLLTAYAFLDKPAKLKGLEPKVAAALEDVDTSSKWETASLLVEIYITNGQSEPAQALTQSLASQAASAPDSEQQMITVYFDRMASSLARASRRDIAAKMYESVSDRSASKYGRYSPRHLDALTRECTFLKRQQMTLESEKIFEEFQKNRPKPQTQEQRIAQFRFLDVFAFQDRDRVVSIADEILSGVPSDGHNPQTYQEAAKLFETARDSDKAAEIYKKALADLAKLLPEEDAFIAKYLPAAAKGRPYLLQELFQTVADNRQKRTVRIRSIAVIVANLLDSANAHNDAKELLKQYLEVLAAHPEEPHHRLAEAVFAYSNICQRENRPRTTPNNPDYNRAALAIVLPVALKHAWGNNPGISGNEPATLKFDLESAGLTNIEVERSSGSKSADDELVKLLQSISPLRALTSAPGKIAFHATFDFKTVTVTVK